MPERLRAAPDNRLRIGVTGHMNLSSATHSLVADRISGVLRLVAGDSVVGVTCLAKGADTIFATETLKAGGFLEVILPASRYRAEKVRDEDLPVFDDLVARAEAVTVMPFVESSRHAYEAANEALLARIDLLVAVWDGKPPVDKGGTAAVVTEAHERGIPVEIAWPQGARREG